MNNDKSYLGTLPKENENYLNVDFWDKRYELEKENDWLLSYEALKCQLHKHIAKNEKILMLGCGNSLLSEMMFKNGFTNIVNIDYSSVVISNMSNHCKDCEKMQWKTMDAGNMSFSDEMFDVVIEKATVDAFLVTCKDQWNIDDETKLFVRKVLKEVSRVLSNKGRFISVSFSQPHFRGPLYADAEYNWSFEKEELGTDFHYYFYTMTKGQQLDHESVFIYKPPTITNRTQCEKDSYLENDDNNLFSIDCD